MPRLSLFSPAVAIALSPRHLRALQARFGGLDGVDLDDRLAVARALFARELPDALVLALEEIERLATLIGREALLEAARGRGLDLSRWLAAPPAYLAARLVLRSYRRSEGGRLARKIVRRARVRVERYFAPSASYEIVSPRGLEREEALTAAAREVHGDALLHGWTVTVGDVVHGAFLHEGPAVRIGRARGGALSLGNVRPIACDCVRFDQTRARVGFQLARPALLPEWTASLGRACSGDPAMLAARPAFTLRPPHERGPSWYDPKALPALFRGVSVVGCELDCGARYGARSPDALGDLVALLGATGGYLVRVTLRFELALGGEARRGLHSTTDATIELPNKLTIADPRFDRDVRSALDALLLTTPGALADDLGSLAPFEHAAWRWSEVVTAEGFASGVATRLFIPSTLRRRAADVAHRPYGSSLVVHPIPGEDAGYALGEDLSVHAYDVPPEGAVRWTLDTARLASGLAARLHLGDVRLRQPAPPGLLPLGALPLGGTHAYVFQLLRLVRDGEAGDLREGLRVACGTAHAVVLVGRGRTLGKGIAQVEVDVARLFDGGELADVVAAIAEALGALGELEPWRFGTKDAPLVLLEERGEAWLGKVRLQITANQLAMLLGLARTPKEWVSANELGRRISPHAAQPDVVVRRARQGWEERIAESFALASVEMPADLPARVIEIDRARGYYRLGIGVVVRG